MTDYRIDRPRDSSHQPVDDIPSFAEPVSSSGRLTHPSPSPSLENGQISRKSHDSEAVQAIVNMAKVMTEMQNLKSEIEVYQAINFSLVEELFAAHCPELSEQKKILSDSEKLIVERLARLQSGWLYDDINAPWNANAT